MLNASFVCFRGISEEAEQRLWREGILSWNDALRESPRCLSPRKIAALRRQIEEAAVMREAGLLEYFLPRFPPAHRARVWAEAGSSAAALDIETTGCTSAAKITTIAVATATGVRTYVAGEDLAGAMGGVAASRLVMTFNGARFDVPMLERHFGLRFPRPHLDLYPVLAALGLRGGQKACEKAIGIKRAPGVAADGAEAVTLWRAWQRDRNAQALTRLTLYNAQDACNLWPLAQYALRCSMQAYPLPSRASNAL